MKYVDFQNFFKNRVLIDVQEVKQVFPDFASRRFYEWQKKGYIKKLASQFYIFADKKISESENNFIANKLFEPSYVSLESALRYYNLIPEVVFLTTSITTRKTKLIKTAVGNFQYRSVKEDLFFGYKIIDQNGVSYKIAESEKALLDFLYLRSDLKTEDDFAELRINEEDYRKTINQVKLNKYLELFGSATLSRKIKALNNVLKI